MSNERRHPMMKCGHAAQGTRHPSGEPCCVICDPPASYEIDEQPPNLNGRTSICNSCQGGEKPGRNKGTVAPKAPSSSKLPFFAYQGPGSHYAEYHCVYCGESKGAHTWAAEHTCGNFTPGGTNRFDQHYCGCQGWD